MSMLPALPRNFLNPGNGGQGNRPSEETVNILNPRNGGPGNRPSEEALLTDTSPPRPGNDNQVNAATAAAMIILRSPQGRGQWSSLLRRKVM